MITKVSHITLFVHDQDKALDFYTNKLDFALHTDVMWGEFRWLTICPKNQRDFEIILYPASSPEEKALVGKQGAKIPLLSLETDNCKADFAVLKQKGVKFTQDPEDKPWGVNAILEDLYGNIYNLVEPKQM